MDEHLSKIDHINTLENKLSKNVGLLHKAKPFLNAKAMKSYLTYVNKASCSLSMTKLKRFLAKKNKRQKQSQ